MKIYLASASPRRKELLKQVGLSFKTRPSTVEEKITKTEPDEVVEELSYQKAVDVCGKLSREEKEDFVVIGADTVVSCWGEILGKPKDKEDAVRMLKKTAGRQSSGLYGSDACMEISEYVGHVCHLQRVHGCDYVLHDGSGDQTVCRQRGTFGQAGAYAIQGLCAAYIQGICGDYNNVVGLPVGRVCQELRKRGLL